MNISSNVISTPNSVNKLNLNLKLEGMYANAVAQEVERFCVESCNGCQVGHPSQRQHDCLMMNENERWQMYGLQAIERGNGKRVVWNEFAEAMRVLKLAVDRGVLEHLQQMEKDPDSTFVDSLMELYQYTENHELQCILNYLFHWRLEDPLESVAETFFLYPPSYMYYVKATGGGVRKLGLGVAGTDGAISTDSLGCGISAGTSGVV
jgi:hypothetical protein